VPVLVGTSGWQYDSWRRGFYPAELAKGRWLEHYADRFATVELNNSFYRLPQVGAFQGWATRTPGDFVLSVKMSRYLTHIRRLGDPRQPVALFMDRARHLGSKLGPILLQLPPTLGCDVDSLDDTLACFPPGVRITVEFRHQSWFNDEVRRVMASRGAAWCLTDRMGSTSPEIRTADWGYLRLHQGRGRPDPCYGRTALTTWVTRLKELWGPDPDIYVYFNNDGHCCAVRDAHVFAVLAEHAGLPATRVPRAGEVHLT
jgi:uncharacterized protein YecE (DUF72 family)